MKKKEFNIPLSNGLNVLVDEHDYSIYSPYKWHKLSRYAARKITVNGKRVVLSMHRLIVSAKAGEYVDHINGNPLDNRRSNLRITNMHGNCCNRGMNRRNKYGYKGVYRSNIKRKAVRYVANLTSHYKQYVGPLRKTPEEAAMDYNTLALKHHGEYAYQNIIKVGKK